MGAVGNTFVTLMDLASRMENGSVAKAIIEMLSQQNEILDDIPWEECNDGAGHVTTIRTGISDPTWRRLYEGVAQGKSTTAQVRDTTAMMRNYSTIDADLLKRAKDPARFRLTEDLAIIEGFNQALAESLFYGNKSTNPERFDGLSPRFNDSTAENGDHILKAGGAANCTSIWLVVWSPITAHGLYPQGSKAGLEQKDLGEQTVYDSNNKPYQAARALYGWDCGLSVRDWRYVVRIPNIDVTALKKDAATGADLVDLMTQALEIVQGLNVGRPAFYCNRTIRGYLRRQMMNRSNLALSMEQIYGKKVMAIDGVPVRRCDALLNTETAVS